MIDQPEAEVTEKPPVSIRKRLLAFGGVVALCLVAAGIAQWKMQRSRQDKALKEMLADLDESEPGWRLEDLDSARPTLPEHLNSARTVVAAHRLLPKGVPDQKTLEPLLKVPAPQLLDARDLLVMEKDLLPAWAALVEARKLADRPDGRHHLTLAAHPYGTLLTDQQYTREIASLLQYDSLRLAQKGESKEALRSGRAVLNTARSLGDEPFFVSQLIRIACVAIAGNSIERTLALGEPPPEDLASLEKLLAIEEAHPTYLVGLRGERATLHAVFTGIANATLSIKGFFDRNDSSLAWREDYMRWTLQDMARRDHPKMMELMGKAIDNARLPTHEQKAAEEALDAEIKSMIPGGSLVPLLVPATNKVAESARRKLAQVRCLRVLLALEQHRQAKGAWPAKLEELTPKLLPAVPLDPFDGKALRYRRAADGVIVYSVGADTKDDGGDLGPGKPGVSPRDVGYRLWDVKHRRQPAKRLP